ncbi:MAG: SDR family oxidoreductase [Chloroflexota bacterium]|nr:MAG: SDR family oxidoreductase [Chloroflexota bacterium]
MSGMLEGKAAVVTGAGGGIGRVIALSLAEQGASVVVNDLGTALDGSGNSGRPADAVVAEIREGGGKAEPNYESVADFAGAERIINACKTSFGRLDILVNVAGIERPAMIFNMTQAHWSQVLAVHLDGTFNCMRHACVVMREQKDGRIINVASDAWRGSVGHVNYAAAKGGIVSLTTSAAREMGRYGVTVNTIVPLAATRMTLDEDTRRGFQKRYEAGLITREKLESILNIPGPEHVGPLVAYLVSDRAGAINGQIFHVEAERISIYSQPVEVKSVYRDHEKYGKWTVEEIATLVPKTLLVDYVNPAPAQLEGKK